MATGVSPTNETLAAVSSLLCSEAACEPGGVPGAGGGGDASSLIAVCGLIGAALLCCWFVSDPQETEPRHRAIDRSTGDRRVGDTNAWRSLMATESGRRLLGTDRWQCAHRHAHHSGSARAWPAKASTMASSHHSTTTGAQVDTPAPTMSGTPVDLTTVAVPCPPAPAGSTRITRELTVG